ncbi:unnamed protein product [Onchocerca flexuosa]|uniref:Uncharacterized protein n=1 Tax=Onchocerca flexuosa TaxID=387005 RepID=A0A3P7ZSD7_9BILA|nr:unnamed protein product [Onchocerca flexuosa]
MFANLQFTSYPSYIYEFTGKQKKLNRNLLGAAASAATPPTLTTNCLKTTQSVTKYAKTVVEKESGTVTNMIENDAGTGAANDK